jgi:enoyl-CoA hydratase/carnithine racemase
MGGPIGFSRTDGIVTLTIDRPGEKNMLSDEAIDLLNNHFLALEKDPSVRVVVLTGAGKDFFCGGIFNPAQKAKLSSEQIRLRRRRAVELFERIEKGVHPVIGAINGRAQAGGFEMALACDIRIAASHSTFNLPETSWGGFPGAGGPFRLSRLVGTGKAMEIIMTGRDVRSDEALRIGLVEQVVPSEMFEPEVFKTAERISATSPLGNRAVKRLVRASVESSGRAIQSLSDSLREFVGSSEDAAEGAAAHLEGRPPRFKGK